MYFVAGVNKNSSRCFGYFKKLEDAIKSVKCNNTDINEMGYYPLAVIEYKEEGFYPIGATYSDKDGYITLFERLWFKYNDVSGEYEPIEEPEEFKIWGNLTL